MEVSKVYYKRYLQMFPFGSKRDEALYNLTSSIIPQDFYDFRYKIFPNGSTLCREVITNQMIDNSVNYYKEIIEKHKGSKYYEKSYAGILNALIMDGRFTDAEKIIEEGLNLDNENISLQQPSLRC